MVFRGAEATAHALAAHVVPTDATVAETPSAQSYGGFGGVGTSAPPVTDGLVVEVPPAQVTVAGKPVAVEVPTNGDIHAPQLRDPPTKSGVEKV